MITLPSCSEAGDDSGTSSRYTPTIEVLPPEEFRPRISYSVWLGPEVRIARSGMPCDRVLKSVTPRSAMLAAVSTVMLIGVSCASVLRFVAVTTTVVSSSVGAAAVAVLVVAAGPDC